MAFLSGIISKITTDTVGTVADKVGSGLGSIMDRCGFVEKLSDAKKIDKLVEVLHIDEASTDSAREMFMAEMQTQKMPWFIRLLNGIVRPMGGIGALLCEFYAIVGANISNYLGVSFIPIELSMEQHAFLLGICAFYFGSRSREVMNGTSTQR